jgi:hypothetical protein
MNNKICGCSTETCGCCEGIQVVTPMTTANRPGLNSLSYRIGTHGAFLESMKARLSTMSVTVTASDGQTRQTFRPLQSLTTRDPGDFSITLLDGWATVADVLTFYQERIANEGYLRTATERRSVLELARLVGYSLRPGVASSVYLSYTVDDNQKEPVVIDPGARSQSVPEGPGDRPQIFETSEKLMARAEWSNLQVRVTQSQEINLINNDTDIDTDTLYFQGVSTGLKPNEPLLLDFTSKQILLYVKSIEADFPNNRTKVVLQAKEKVATTSRNLGSQAHTKADSNVFDALVEPLSRPPTPQVASGAFLQRTLKDSFGNTSDSLPQLVSMFSPIIADTIYPAWSNAVTVPAEPPKIYAFRVKATPFGSTAPLKQITDEQGKVIGSEEWPLAGAVTIGVQIVTKQLFLRDVNHEVSSTTESSRFVVLSIIDGLDSLGATINYQEGETETVLSSKWRVVINNTNDNLINSNVDFIAEGESNKRTVTFKSDPATGTVSILTGSVTYNVSVGQSIRVTNTEGDVSIQFTRSFNITTLGFSQSTPLFPKVNILDLDAQYDQIIPGTWAVVVRSDRTKNDKIDNPLISKILLTQNISKTAYNISGKSTELMLEKDWLTTLHDLYLSDVSDTTVYAQSEEFLLSEMPISSSYLDAPDDIQGDTIVLKRIYNGLQKGSWIIVSGYDSAGKIITRELAKVSKVENNDLTTLTLAKPLAYPYTRGAFSIFTSIDIQGDTIELQRLYDGLQSARWIIVSGERTDVIVDNAPIAGINDSELAMIAAVNQPLPALSGDKVHTTLTLAKPLAHSYKLETISIFANVVKATHGSTTSPPETLGAGDSSKALQTFSLKQPPLTFVPAPNASGVDSTLKVYVNDVEWKETDSLAGLGPKDRNFVTKTDDDGKTSVIFGNGKQGARLPTGLENVKAVYRSGIGKPGNVKVGQISLLQTRPLGVKSVTNPLAASGGADKETRDQARENAPLAVMALDRLVSIQDYADFTRTFAGIGKASARKLSDGRRQLVHITIAGADDIPIDPSSDLYRNLLSGLRQLGDPDLALQVEARELIVLVVSANIRLVSGYLWEPVKANITAEILYAFGFQRRALGQPALLCELIALIQNIAGVEYVDVDSFNGIPEKLAQDGTRKLLTLAELSKAALNTDNQPRPYILVNIADFEKDGTIHPAQLAIFTPDTILLNQTS